MLSDEDDIIIIIIIISQTVIIEKNRVRFFFNTKQLRSWATDCVSDKKRIDRGNFTRVLTTD